MKVWYKLYEICEERYYTVYFRGWFLATSDQRQTFTVSTFQQTFPAGFCRRQLSEEKMGGGLLE